MGRCIEPPTMQDSITDSHAAVDFGTITENVRHYEPPADGLDTPYSIDAAAEGLTPSVLNELIYRLDERGVEPEKCAFYLPLDWYMGFWNLTDAQTYGDTYHERPIRTHPTVPEDVALYFAPDAVGLGGMVYNPLCIAYADVGAPPE